MTAGKNQEHTAPTPKLPTTVWALGYVSLLAGWLWQHLGPATTFYAGALMAAISLGGFLRLNSHLKFSRKNSV